MPELHESQLPAPSELEITAELPILPDGSHPGEELVDTAIFPPAGAAAPSVSDQLERQLRELGSNLRDLEARLQQKSEQQSRHEQELAARDAQIGQMRAEVERAQSALQSERQRLLSLTTDESRLREARHDGERLREALQRRDFRRHIHENQLLESEQRVDARDAHITALLAELQLAGAARQRREQELAAERDRLQQQLAAMRAAEQALVERQRELEQQKQQEQAMDSDALQTANSRLLALEREVAEARQRAEELESESAANVEMVRALHEQLYKAREERQRAEALLTEREARLEQAAASNAELLGSIQQRLAGRQPDAQHTALAPPPDLDEPPQTGPVEPVLLSLDELPGGTHRVGRRTTIGRTPDNALCIDADYISRHHAVLLGSAGEVILQDLDSTNGVFVNGERVQRATLRNGDRVTIGKCDFRFLLMPVRG